MLLQDIRNTGVLSKRLEFCCWLLRFADRMVEEAGAGDRVAALYCCFCLFSNRPGTV